MFDSLGTAIAGTPQDTRQLHVELKALVEQGIDNDVEEVRWANWYRPLNLTRF